MVMVMISFSRYLSSRSNHSRGDGSHLLEVLYTKGKCLRQKEVVTSLQSSR
jgi:hypothetical protein